MPRSGLRPRAQSCRGHRGAARARPPPSPSQAPARCPSTSSPRMAHMLPAPANCLTRSATCALPGGGGQAGAARKRPTLLLLLTRGRSDARAAARAGRRPATAVAAGPHTPCAHPEVAPAPAPRELAGGWTPRQAGCTSEPIRRSSPLTALLTLLRPSSIPTSPRSLCGPRAATACRRAAPLGAGHGRARALRHPPAHRSTGLAGWHAPAAPVHPPARTDTRPPAGHRRRCGRRPLSLRTCRLQRV